MGDQSIYTPHDTPLTLDTSGSGFGYEYSKQTCSPRTLYKGNIWLIIFEKILNDSVFD